MMHGGRGREGSEAGVAQSGLRRLAAADAAAARRQQGSRAAPLVGVERDGRKRGGARGAAGSRRHLAGLVQCGGVGVIHKLDAGGRQARGQVPASRGGRRAGGGRRLRMHTPCQASWSESGVRVAVGTAAAAGGCGPGWGRRAGGAWRRLAPGGGIPLLPDSEVVSPCPPAGLACLVEEVKLGVVAIGAGQEHGPGAGVAPQRLARRIHRHVVKVKVKVGKSLHRLNFPVLTSSFRPLFDLPDAPSAVPPTSSEWVPGRPVPKPWRF